MRQNERQQGIIGAAAFFIAYLSLRIFLPAAWQFFAGCVVRWWHHGGPWDLAVACVGALIYGAWKAHRARVAVAGTLPSASRTGAV